MKVLVLGHTGMLGHMVKKYLNETCDCETTDKRWPTKSFRRFIKHWKGDYIINCIGQIPQKDNKNYIINYLLPIWLDNNASANIIHPGTDCEMDDNEYGISKKKASDWIKSKGELTKIIKTSIIGPELNTKFSLMEWFLDIGKKCFGYSEVYWNGNTALVWAKYCLLLMNHWEWCEKETILESPRISKYQLLKIIAEVFNKNIKIEKMDVPKANKCLKGMRTKNIKDQLINLKEFYYGKE